MSLLRQILENVEEVCEKADNTGCSDDLTVTDYWAVNRLEEMLPVFREFVIEWERAQAKSLFPTQTKTRTIIL